MNEVAHIYNNLFRYESKAKSSSYPIHKKLKFEDNLTLLDFILDKVSFNAGECVLDAGCGTGHTLIYLSQKHDIFGTGISISQNEVEFALKEVKRLDLKERIKIRLKNYDDGLSDKYDKIICIESLKHSRNFRNTIENILYSLAKGGTLIIADDFVVDKSNLSRRHNKLWEAHASNNLKDLLTIKQYFDDVDLVTYNLSKYVATKSQWFLNILRLIIHLATFLSNGKIKRNLETYLGAILLELLYKKQLAKYYVLIINKR